MLGLQRLDDGAIFNPTIPYLELMFPLQRELRLFMHTPMCVGSIRIHRSHTRSRGVEAALWMICVEKWESADHSVEEGKLHGVATHTNSHRFLVAHRCMQTRWQSKSLTPAVPHLFYFKRGQTPNERISAALCSQMKHVWCKEHITHIADVHIPGCSNWAGSAMLQYTYNTHSPICQAGRPFRNSSRWSGSWLNGCSECLYRYQMKINESW